VITNATHPTILFTDADFDDSLTYTINVLATVTISGKHFQMAYFPRTIMFGDGSGDDSGSLGLYLLIGIILVILVLCTGLAMLFFVKYRIVEQKLDYEMNDVRNVAGVSAPADPGHIAQRAAASQKKEYEQLES
jgi:hypothetical protein